MAEIDLLKGNDGILFDSAFTRGEDSIPINGLVWMGDYKLMYNQIRSKIENGYRCIKLKIGALYFDKELELIDSIRSDYSQEDIELRVDANGAFTPSEALEKLKVLAEFQIHSIETTYQAGAMGTDGTSVRKRVH